MTQFPAFKDIQNLLRQPEVTAGGGRPVIGWFCSYTPREIPVAAGLSPYRVLPGPGRVMTRADGYIDRNLCPYVRTCLGEALEERLKFLDGLVVVNSCDHMRRMYDVWRYNIGGDFVFLLDLPRVNRADAVAYFRECLLRFIGEIENHFKVPVTGTALSGAINALNAGRTLLRELYRKNRDRGMPLSAANVSAIVRASTMLPIDTFNGLLARLLGELDDSTAGDAGGPRILITGSVMENPQILELIEKCGARVVGDDLCTGTRLFQDSVESSGDPLGDLSRHYLGCTPCPRMKDAPRRFDHVLRMIADYRVDGVVFYALKFCDPFLFDAPRLKERLVARGIPTLSLEGDYTPGTLGRVRTRVEAFIEMLGENVPIS